MDEPSRTSFRTDEIPGRDRYEAFREAIGVAYEVSRPSREGEEFHASLETTLAHDALLVTCDTVGQAFSRTPVHIANDGLDHFQIQVFSKGINRIDRATHVGPSGTQDLLFIDTALPYAATTNEFTNHTLVVPRRRLARRLRAPDGHHGRALRGDQPLARLARDHLHRLFRYLPHLSAAELDSAIEPTLDLIAAAFNGSVVPDSAESRAVERALTDKVRAHIDCHLDRPTLSPETLCAELRLSRSTLYRLMEPHGGVSQYIRNRRLDRAIRLLGSPRHSHLTLTDIAVQSGFNSDRAFRLAFQRRFGTTPTEARTCEALNENAQRAQGPGHEWANWYRGL